MTRPLTERVLPLLAGVLLSSCTLSPTGPSIAPGDFTQYRVQNAAGGSAKGGPDLGVNASLHGKRIFDGKSAWNRPVANAPVDPNSKALIASIGADKGLHADFDAHGNGIPYVVVPGDTAKLPVSFDYKSQSDPGPYPLPPLAPIEGGINSAGDRHVLVVDRDHWQLYELWSAFPEEGNWKAASGAKFDLAGAGQRPAGWTSADAAGLPIFPGLVRYDEVGELHAIRHALRFTVQHTRKGYVAPARHGVGEKAVGTLPPMGMRVRLKASVDLSGFPPQARVILQALKTYGMILADNGENWHLSGAPDARWSASALRSLQRVSGSDFEVVKMGPVTAQ